MEPNVHECVFAYIYISYQCPPKWGKGLTTGTQYARLAPDFGFQLPRLKGTRLLGNGSS